MWVVISFNYYLIYFQIKYMEGDFYINTIVSSLSELTAYAISGLIIDRLGMKPCYLFSFSVVVTGSTLYLFLRSTYANLTPILLLLTSFGICFGFNINWNSNAVLFPVLYTSSTNGICSLFSRLAGTLTPQLAELEQPWPMVTVAGLSMAAGVLCLFLRKI